jgi:hypothetical protein
MEEELASSAEGVSVQAAAAETLLDAEKIERRHSRLSA